MVLALGVFTQAQGFEAPRRCAALFYSSKILHELPSLSLRSRPSTGSRWLESGAVFLHRPDRHDILRELVRMEGAYPLLITSRGEVMVSVSPIRERDISLTQSLHARLWRMYRQEHGEQAARLIFAGHLLVRKSAVQELRLVMPKASLPHLSSYRSEPTKLARQRLDFAHWLLARYQILDPDVATKLHKVANSEASSIKP